MNKRRFTVAPGATITHNGKVRPAGAVFTGDGDDTQIRRWWRAGVIIPKPTKSKPEPVTQEADDA